MKYVLPKELISKLTSLHLTGSTPAFQRLGRTIAMSLLLGAVAMAFLPWQQTSRGSGRVIAYSPGDRQQNIDAPVEGRLGKWFVQEGSHVSEGDAIVEISDNDPEILNRLKSEQDAFQRRLAAARLATKTSQLNVRRQLELFEKGLSARRAYEQAELEYARYLSEEASSSAELSRIEVRLARQSTQSVKAPRSGTILRRISGQESVLVKSGDLLAVLVPETNSRAVELWVDGNDAPLMTEGREVRLQFEGWPAIQFSGWPSVAIGTFSGKISFVDAVDDGNGKFRVVIVPQKPDWPHPRYLRQGVRANGWVLLDQVSVGYEIWRQFNAFPPSLKDAPDSGKFWSEEAEKK